ncbi:MAG: PAS domain-containing protein [Deltaproteobacteria bacterium]|nr:PAS domain-containing protein [Deltaproteobacteria bacterium]
MLQNHLKRFAELLIDSYFVVDRDRNIVDFNRAFYSMLPRGVARKLKTKKCYEVLQLDICKEKCIAQECWRSNSHVRLDEITGTLEGDDSELRFILSAIPIHDDNGEIIGAIEMQRNVTDEALVQSKYQQQLDASSKELNQLRDEMHSRTRRLLEVSRRLANSQQELVRAKTDLFG